MVILRRVPSLKMPLLRITYQGLNGCIVADIRLIWDGNKGTVAQYLVEILIPRQSSKICNFGCSSQVNLACLKSPSIVQWVWTAQLGVYADGITANHHWGFQLYATPGHSAFWSNDICDFQSPLGSVNDVNQHNVTVLMPSQFTALMAS